MNSGTPELNFQYSSNQLTDSNGNLLNNQLFNGYISKDSMNNYNNQAYGQTNMDGINNNEMCNNYTTSPMNVFGNKSIDNSSPNSNISNSNSNTNSNDNSNGNRNIEISNQSSQHNSMSLSEEEIHQRRKAQNRAAQRAFRERKEGKLKELSGKLKEAELLREKLESQLNDLKEKNLLLDMENQMLQKRQQHIQFQQTIPSSTFESTTINFDKSPLTNSDSNNNNNININNSSNNSNNNSNKGLGFNEILSFKFPNTTKCDFIDGTIDWESHGRSNESEIYANKIGESYKHENEKVLTISAIWDYLVEFTNLNEDYTIDIPGIMSELRGKEVCHGFGPAYPLNLVNEIILKYIENNS